MAIQSLLAVLIPISGFAWAPSNVDVFDSSMPQTACFGDPRDPVRAVYLHGLFPIGKDPLQYRDLENANREKLKRFAHENRIRIALPIAPYVTAAGYRRWQDSHTVGKITALAESACGEALAPKRCLMGFSRGGIWLDDKADSCDNIASYNSTVAFGTNPNTAVPRKCNGKAKNIPNNHSFLPLDVLRELCEF